MKFLEYPSAKSLNRGYWSFKENKILKCTKIDNNSYRGVCLGSNSEKYEVTIDLEHPTRSTCTCPYANGKKIVCKHKVALYFQVFPDEAEKYYNDLILELENYEKEDARLREQVRKYINRMNKSDLQELAYNLITYDEKQFYYFVNHILPEEYL